MPPCCWHDKDHHRNLQDGWHRNTTKGQPVENDERHPRDKDDNIQEKDGQEGSSVASVLSPGRNHLFLTIYIGNWCVSALQIGDFCSFWAGSRFTGNLTNSCNGFRLPSGNSQQPDCRNDCYAYRDGYVGNQEYEIVTALDLFLLLFTHVSLKLHVLQASLE